MAPAWIGGGSGGLKTWVLERPAEGLIRFSISRRLHWGQILGSLAFGPGLLFLLYKTGFWADPEQPLLIKGLVGLMILFAFSGLIGSSHPPYIDFDFAKGELRLYLFPELKRTVLSAQWKKLILREGRYTDTSFDLPHSEYFTHSLCLELKDGEIVGLVESTDRTRLYKASEELVRRMQIPFDPGHFYENSHMERQRPSRRRK